jgi:hypothetical protein
VQIAYSQPLSGGAAGSFTMALGIWNRGARACRLRGWATIQFLNATGGLVPTHWVESTGDFSGSAQPVAVSVLPCAASGGCGTVSTPGAYISVAGNDVVEPCVKAARVRVLLPGSSQPVIDDLQAQGFGDAWTFCSDGSVSLLPIVSTYSPLGPPYA